MAHDYHELENVLRHERARVDEARTCYGPHVPSPTSDGPRHMHGPGKPVRTYQQSQFVCALWEAIAGLEAGAKGDCKAAQVAAEKARAFLGKHE